MKEKQEGHFKMGLPNIVKISLGANKYILIFIWDNFSSEIKKKKDKK